VDRITSVVSTAGMDVANVNANKHARRKVEPFGFDAVIGLPQVKLRLGLLRTKQESTSAPTIPGR